jgi:midasin (ATPase involved in ribosome maturation)
MQCLPRDLNRHAELLHACVWLLLNVKNDIVFKKATLYEREVIKKQTFFIRWQKLPYSYNRWLGNHSLKATYYVNQLLSSFYTRIKISMTLEAWNTRMHHSFNFIRKFKPRLPNHLLYEYGSFCQRIKNFCFFITSRSYNVAFLKRYRFLHLIFAFFRTLPLL